MRPSSILTTILKLTLIGIAAFVVGGSTWAYAVTPKDFGGKGDVVFLHDGAISAGTDSFFSNSATFALADVGKAIVVTRAGTGGGALVTKIQGFVSPTQVTLAASAGTTVSDTLTYFATDDTAAIRSCVYKGTAKGGVCTINDGVTFLMSSTASTITPFSAGSNPIQKGIIDGHGKIIFAPQGNLVGNDRLFYISSQETYPLKIAPGGIAKGATSFRAQDPSDAARLSPGDWVIIAERDSTVKDHVYADWMEVASVDGAVVHTAKPFRMAFPNARPWAGPPSYWGLSFRKAGPITSNIEIRDITIVIPKINDKHGVVGIASRDTRSTLIEHINCQDASGNCFAGYMDQGMTFRNNNINESVYSEFAAMVDAVISGNHFNEPGNVLALPPGPPVSGGLEVDFGTGFSSVTENVIGPSLQVCINVSPGVHDTLVKGNSCGLVTFGSGASCIFSRGGYRLTITENTCIGGTKAARGIDVTDATNLAAPMYSEGNRIFNNKVQGFATPYVCNTGRLRSDTCDQR
jgi:hypothetical protein